jgi:hypothetical protein
VTPDTHSTRSWSERKEELADGFWFIGAQSESTGGVLNVMTGAQKVAKRILEGD